MYHSSLTMMLEEIVPIGGQDAMYVGSASRPAFLRIRSEYQMFLFAVGRKRPAAKCSGVTHYDRGHAPSLWIHLYFDTGPAKSREGGRVCSDPVPKRCRAEKRNDPMRDTL